MCGEFIEKELLTNQEELWSMELATVMLKILRFAVRSLRLKCKIIVVYCLHIFVLLNESTSIHSLPPALKCELTNFTALLRLICHNLNDKHICRRTP